MGSGVAATLLVLPAACTEDAPAATEPEPAVLAGHVLRTQSAPEPRVWGLARGSARVGRAEPLPIGTGWGPSRRTIERARAAVGRMSLRERAGQVIVAHYPGTAPPVGLVRRLHLGGVVLFDGNVASNDQVRASNRALQQSVRRDGRRFGVTIAVDQEGGAVERVTTATRFPAFMTAGAAGSLALTRAAATASGQELAGLGFTADYAPVADVTTGAADPVIRSRSVGSDPGQVTAHAIAAARGYRAAGVVPALKHFPGHGSVTADSHLTLPVQRRSRSELAAADLVPFRAGIRAGLPSVMVGHLDVRAVDPGVPSSLSRKVVTGLLRQRLGFEGLVVTDALNMGAVTRTHDSARSAVAALRAGVDVLLMPPSPQQARDGIVRAVRSGRLASQRLDQAATRHVALLMHQRGRAAQRRPVRAPGSSWTESASWSAAALTSVSGPCTGRLVGEKVKLTGDAAAGATFRSIAEDAGLRFGKKGTKVRLLGRGDGAAPGDVVVALADPYVLGASDAPVRLATYGSTPGAISVLVSHLLGNAPAPGRLPVPVAGVDRSGC